MVRQRSAKPSFAGSIPAVASSFRISPPPGFSFENTVESHGWYRLAPFRWNDGVLSRPEAIAGNVADLTIRVKRGKIEVSGISREWRSEVEHRITRMLQLDVDTSEFLALAGRSPTHIWAVESSFGRLLCGSTLFEDVVKIIATTNTMWRQTVRMIELLVAKCGKKSPLGYPAFPDPEDVARFSENDLQQDCRLGYRARSIHRLASGVASGSIDLARISNANQTTEELFEAYRSLPGIGPYGAAHLLAMDGRHDFIAVDTEFRRFVRDTYHGGRRVSDRTMLRRYRSWGRWKYLAYWSELWSASRE